MQNNVCKMGSNSLYSVHVHCSAIMYQCLPWTESEVY